METGSKNSGARRQVPGAGRPRRAREHCPGPV